MKTLTTEMKRMLINYLQPYECVSLCCDGWSLLKPDVNMEVFFVNTFRNNEFKSYLFDMCSYKSATAKNLQAFLSPIEDSLGNQLSFITTDGGRNNTAAFKSKRSICFCHAFNTVINHMIKNPKRTSEYGLTINERQCLHDHFNKIHTLCVKVRGQHRKQFAEWVKKWKSVNTDFPESIPLPETICATRWIGVADYMRWLLTVGRLFYRFVFANHLTKEFSYLMGILHLLQETAWLVFLVEHFMSLLIVSDKPILHLVIPILEGLKTILQSKPCTDFIVGDKVMDIKHPNSNSIQMFIENTH